MNDGRLTVPGSLINIRCWLQGWNYTDRKSSLVWATGYTSPAPDGPQVERTRQEWDWERARTSYVQALSAVDKADQDTGFADTFQALGHVVHLIQDGAQPAHVRNDFESHLPKLTLIISEALKGWVGSPYEHYVKIRTDELLNGMEWSPRYLKAI